VPKRSAGCCLTATTWTERGLWTKTSATRSSQTTVTEFWYLFSLRQNFENPPGYDDADSMQAVLDYNRDKRVSIEDFEGLALKYLCPQFQIQTKLSGSYVEKYIEG
jgi:hypothetical protein